LEDQYQKWNHLRNPWRWRELKVLIQLKTKKKISILIPAYNEQGNIPSLISRLEHLYVKLKSQYDFEFLLLDNNSKDRTRELALQQCQNNKLWKYLRYSRNFGAESSILAGLDHVTGDATIIVFSDLQDPPENIPVMLEKWEAGAEVVYGVINKRNDSNILKTLGAKSAYFLIHHLTDSKIPVDATDFRLLDRKVVDALRALREPDRYFRGLVHWVGFKEDAFLYDRDKRVAGKSNANFIYCVKFALHAIVCFSSKPMHFILAAGILLTCISIIAAFIYTILFFVRPAFLIPPPPGMTTVVILVCLALGINSLFLGIIGEYVGRIYNQGKARPLYIVSEKVNF
jgi:glycosyltransferase involved in cell wall biosynthesis